MTGRITKSVVLAAVDGDANARITKSVVLILNAVAHPVYITKSAVLVLASESCITQLCQCWKIVRRDGDAFYFTTHNEPVTLFGDVYEPCSSLSASAFESGILSSRSGAAGDVEINGILAAGGISHDDLIGGLFDGAEVTAYSVPWSTENSAGGSLLAKGFIREVTSDESGYSMSVATIGVKLGEAPLIDLYSPLCRYQLGVGLCPVNLAALEFNGTVSGLAAPEPMNNFSYRRFFDSTLTATDGYFAGGRLVWNTGENAGISSEVKGHTSANDLITLWDAMPFKVEIGDTYTITPGCNKTQTDHTVKFSLGFGTFGGQPGLPGNDFLRRGV